MPEAEHIALRAASVRDGMPGSSERERLEAHLEAEQAGLLCYLGALRRARGLATDDVLREMSSAGWTAEAVERFEDGAYDPTLAEIRRYAKLVGARLSADVRPFGEWEAAALADHARFVRDRAERAAALRVWESEGGSQ